MTGPIDETPTDGGWECIGLRLVRAFRRFWSSAGHPRQTFGTLRRPVVRTAAPFKAHGTRGPSFRVHGRRRTYPAAISAAVWRSRLVLLFMASAVAAQVFGAGDGLDQHVLRSFDDRIAIKPDEKLIA